MYCGQHKSYRHQGQVTRVDTLVRTAADMRVSDRERDAVVDALRKHTGEGRLTMEEFEERTAEALAAKTGAELRTTLRDLPAPRTQSTNRRSGWRRLPHDVTWLAPAVVVAAVIAAIGGPVWPLWVVGPWLAFIVVGALMCAPRRLWHEGRGLRG